MQVLPVLDLMNGSIVQGRGGRRETYRPIESVCCADAHPVTVARTFVERFGFDRTYVADLDAIQGGEPAWSVYRELTECGLSLWIDAGLTNVDRAKSLADADVLSEPVASVIVGLESIPDDQTLEAIAHCIGPERTVFSLDLHEGKLFTDSPGWESRSPMEMLDIALNVGIYRFIVLDLARVGMGGGIGTAPLCRALRKRAPHVELVSGGGVRTWEDVERLARAGCDSVLVASALHNGSITAGDLRGSRRRD